MAGEVPAQSSNADIRLDADGAFGAFANLNSAFPVGRVIVIGPQCASIVTPADTEMASSGGHTIQIFIDIRCQVLLAVGTYPNCTNGNWQLVSVIDGAEASGNWNISR